MSPVPVCARLTVTHGPWPVPCPPCPLAGPCIPGRSHAGVASLPLVSMSMPGESPIGPCLVPTCPVVSPSHVPENARKWFVCCRSLSDVGLLSTNQRPLMALCGPTFRALELSTPAWGAPHRSLHTTSEAMILQNPKLYTEKMQSLFYAKSRGFGRGRGTNRLSRVW